MKINNASKSTMIKKAARTHLGPIPSSKVLQHRNAKRPGNRKQQRDQAIANSE